MRPSLRDAYTEAIDKFVTSLAELEPWTAGQVATSMLGNADDADLFGDSKGRRLIVTSPPYATALPYIDTDRLSIMALGLATPSQTRGSSVPDRQPRMDDPHGEGLAASDGRQRPLAAVRGHPATRSDRGGQPGERCGLPAG